MPIIILSLISLLVIGLIVFILVKDNKFVRDIISKITDEDITKEKERVIVLEEREINKTINNIEESKKHLSKLIKGDINNG